ncbi:MAG: hypothetical protein D6722_11575 [Bacteroidetes bacterium]|nr:MAG: hypothetical protein D6722_11575 [Bacteroidota bacterium]
MRAHRRRLWLLILVSSGLDILIFLPEIPVLFSWFGSSLILDELIEYFISTAIARSRLKLHPGYKVAGLIPIPGVTALSLQAAHALIRSWRKPEKVLASLEAAPQ